MPLSELRPSRRPVAAGGVLAILLPIAMTGCRTYEPAPLDLAGHGRRVRDRLESLETLAVIDGFLA